MSDLAPGGRLAIIHIGPMKTGSTSIQTWLARARRPLEQHGVYVPMHSKSTNLSRLSRTFQASAGEIRKDRVPANAMAARELLMADLKALPTTAHTCVFSAEMFAHMMKRPSIEQLKEALEPYFDRWLVVIYLRRQIDLAVSRFSTSSRQGRKAKLARPFDYARVLHDWSAVFGREAIRPRLYSRDELVDGDVVADFIATAGLPQIRSRAQARERNPSLKPEAQVFLDALTRRLKADGSSIRTIQQRGAVLGALNSHHSGPGRQPRREEVIRFMAQAEETNEQVRAEWFPDRQALFDSEYSKFPETDSAEPTAEKLLEVALDVLSALLGTDRSAKGAETPAGLRSNRVSQAKEATKRPARRTAKRAAQQTSA